MAPAGARYRDTQLVAPPPLLNALERVLIQGHIELLPLAPHLRSRCDRGWLLRFVVEPPKHHGFLLQSLDQY